MSVKSAQGRWKNIALTVYLICPLALFTGLCWWIMVSLQLRLENQGRMREQVEQQQLQDGATLNSEVEAEVEEAEGLNGGAPENRNEGQDETGG